MPRLCTLEGCAKVHKARGFCSTHYNQTLPGRHKKIEVPCARCGKRAPKERQVRYALRYCSSECRDLHRSERARLRNSQVEAWKPRPLWHTAHLAYATTRREVSPWISARCKICGGTFLDKFGSATCGTECQAHHRLAVRREGKHRRRALERNAYVARVHRHEVFRRDNYTCQLCLEPMDMSKRAPHPRSPSIDHIIALANGGTHEPANVQSACFLCNALKGDREWAAA